LTHKFGQVCLVLSIRSSHRAHASGAAAAMHVTRVAVGFRPPQVAVEVRSTDGVDAGLMALVLGISEEKTGARAEIAKEVRARLDARGIETNAKARRHLAEALEHLCDRLAAEEALECGRDLNGVSAGVLAHAKQIMESRCNTVRPGDAAFVYDKKVDFEEGLSDNSWDDDDDESSHEAEE